MKLMLLWVGVSEAVLLIEKAFVREAQKVVIEVVPLLVSELEKVLALLALKQALLSSGLLSDLEVESLRY